MKMTSLFLAGALLLSLPSYGAEPYQYGPRDEIMLSTDWGNWEKALADSLDLRKIPDNLQWVNYKKPFPGRAKLETRMRGVVARALNKKRFLGSDGDFLQKKNRTQWNRCFVEIPAGYRKNHSVYFTAERASYKFALYVNGIFAGESLQAALPKEMDVTPFLKDGKNEILCAFTVREGIYDLKKQMFMAPHTGCEIGIIGPVRLEFRPQVFVDDVFVKTSVRKKNIDCRITLKNSSRKDAVVTPSVRIVQEDDSRKILTEIAGGKVRVPAGKTVEVSLKKNWIAPQLWGTDSTMTYIATTALSDESGKTIDLYPQPFGFREIWTRGKDLILNGFPIVLLRSSPLIFERDMDQVKPVNGSWRKYISLNAGRTHLGGTPMWFIRRLQKTGMFFIPESSVCGTDTKLDGKDLDLDSVMEYFKGWAKLLRNEPSVIMYSLTNELFWDRNLPEEMKVADRIVKTIRDADPTRLLQGDGENSWNGRLDTINIHYPEAVAGTLRLKYPNSGFAMPNDLWWLTEKGAPNGGWRTQPFKWDRPLIFGEFYFQTDHSNVGDDYYNWLLWDHDVLWTNDADIYARGRRSRVVENLRRMCNYYRALGVAGLNTWMNDQDYTMPYSAVEPLDYQANVRSGSTFRRKYVIFNNGACPMRRLVWKLYGEHGILAEGTKNISVNNGEKLLGEIEFKAPVTNRPVKARLFAQVLFGNAEQARFEQKLYILPEQYDLSALTDKIAVIDPGKRLESRLSALNLGKAERIGGETAVSPGTKLLLIAEDAFRSSMRKQLDRFVENGGTAVILAQKEWLPYRSDLPERDLQHAATETWIRSKGHPVLDGIEEEQLSFWGKDNVVSYETFFKPTAGNFKSIIDCGGIHGLVWSPLMECRLGKGSVLMSTLTLEKEDPVALKMLRNILVYGCGRKAFSAEPLNLLAGKNFRIPEFMDSIFAKTKNGIGKSGPILVDASAEFDPAELKREAEKGRTVWLHGLTPENLKKFGKLIPSAISLKARPKEKIGGMPVGNDALVNGISNFDFAWYSVTHGQGHQTYWRFAKTTAEPPAWVVEINDPEGNALPLSAPAFLAKVKIGKGALILDTLRWESAVDKESDKVRRTLATFLSNLNVEFAPVVHKQYNYVSVDFRRFANMGYWDRVADDGKGGWTDQGRNDMRLFLINHTGKGGAEDEGMEVSVPNFPENISFLRIPFRLIDPKRNGGKAILSFGSADFGKKLMRNVSGIPVGAKADRFWVLHTSAWLVCPPGTKIAEYEFEYTDGSKAVVPVLAGIDVADWHGAKNAQNCKVAWSGQNKLGNVSVMLSSWKNPHPEKEIGKLNIRAGLSCPQYVVLGITLGTELDVLSRRVPESRLKLDFEQPEEKIPLKKQSVRKPAKKKENGFRFTRDCELIYEFPRNLADFMNFPCELEFELTLESYPRTYRGMIFNVGTMSVNIQRKSLEIGGLAKDGKWRFARLKNPVERNKRMKFRIRFDGQRVSVFRNGRLEHTEAYSLAPMKMNRLAFGKNGGDACDLNAVIHNLEFFQLVILDETGEKKK